MQSSRIPETAVVTGANTGIGRHVAVDLAARGTRVILVGRSEDRTRPVLEEIAGLPQAPPASFVRLDLGSLASVRSGAERILHLSDRLDLLVNNAGIGGARGTTEDGFEIHFGVNHLGPYLLTRLLLERITAAAPARIVTVASNAHFQARGIDFDAVQRRTASLLTLREYAASKLANVLFSLELARRSGKTGISCLAVHPGTVATDIWRRLPWPLRPLLTRSMLSVEEGAAPVLRLALGDEPDGARHEGYVDRFRARAPSDPARDPELAAELWRRSQSWAGLSSLAG